MTEIVHLSRYTATVRTRREGWPDVRPWVDELEGQTLTFQACGEINPEDSSLYVGEWAMVHDLPLKEGMGTWIASGDLSDIRPADHVRKG